MSDDFPTLRPITTRPVALNLAAWYLPEVGTGKLSFVPESALEDAMSEPLEYHTEHHTQCLLCSGPLAQIVSEVVDDQSYWRCDSCKLVFTASSLSVYGPGEWKRQEEEHTEARRRLYEQSVEDSQWEEEPQADGECYLCHAMPEHDPDVILRNAGLLQSDLYVCSRCDGSWQHQTDKREAWLAEESEV